MKQSNCRTKASRVAASVLLVFSSLAISGPVSAAPTSSTSVTSRLGSVERLLTESSAAKKIEQSGNAEAMELRDQALSRFDDARRASDSGDTEAAEAALKDTIRLMTAAAKAAHGDEAVSSKEAGDYSRRKESIQALASAHDRIATEKGEKKMNKALQGQVSAEISEADALMQAGKPDEAMAALDDAYETIKVSLESLRGGDTLVRELNFETKEDEYKYELDRNDTHQMLIKVLLAEKMANSPMRASAEKFIGQAEELRSQAESAADKKKFEDAIGLLEQSTKELIRAIRSAGVYIPG